MRNWQYFTLNPSLQLAAVQGIFPSVLSANKRNGGQTVRFMQNKDHKRPIRLEIESHNYLLPHPFIYNKSFPNNSRTCVFWRLLTCFKCSLGLCQLSLKFFHCLNKRKVKFIQTLCFFLWTELTMQANLEGKNGTRKTKHIPILLTGLGRSGSRKTTRKICSTATWSLCSSNCTEVSYNTFSSISK